MIGLMAEVSRLRLAAPIALLALCQAPRAEARADDGCPEALEAPTSYRARAREAQGAGDHRRAANELWGLWCSQRDPAVLVKICMEHAQAQDCEHGPALWRFAQRRTQAISQRGNAVLQRCGAKLQRLCGESAGERPASAPPRAPAPELAAVVTAPPAPVPAAPAPPVQATPAPPAPPPQEAEAEAPAAAPEAAAEAPAAAQAPAATGTATADPAGQAVAAAQTGTLRLVLGAPSDGARFFVDDLEYTERDLIATPGVRLPAGRRRISVQKDGYLPFSRDVELQPAGTAVIYVPLRRREAQRPPRHGLRAAGG